LQPIEIRRRLYRVGLQLFENDGIPGSAGQLLDLAQPGIRVLNFQFRPLRRLA
jgi:hypothetical protein